MRHIWAVSVTVTRTAAPSESGLLTWSRDAPTV